MFVIYVQLYNRVLLGSDAGSKISTGYYEVILRHTKPIKVGFKSIFRM